MLPLIIFLLRMWYNIPYTRCRPFLQEKDMIREGLRCRRQPAPRASRQERRGVPEAAAIYSVATYVFTGKTG